MNALTKTTLIGCLLGLAGCSSLVPSSWFSSRTNEATPPPSAAEPAVVAPSRRATPPAPASPRPALHEDTRRTPLSATGYAVIAAQNAKLPAQQRLLAIRAARIDAYRGLAEQVYGLYLDATTTVADLVLKNDAYRSRVEGVIHGAVLTAITPINNDTYEVTLTLDRQTVADLRLLYADFLDRMPGR